MYFGGAPFGLEDGVVIIAAAALALLVRWIIFDAFAEAPPMTLTTKELERLGCKIAPGVFAAEIALDVNGRVVASRDTKGEWFWGGPGFRGWSYRPRFRVQAKTQEET